MSCLSMESLEASLLPKVEFINLSEQHCFDENLKCQYRLVDYKVQEGDRIAIFKLGWQFLKDYVIFEWVSNDSDFVVFKEENLPKDANEIYQLCYITGENAVLGVSKPIHFCKKMLNMYQSQSTFRDSISSSCDSRNSSPFISKFNDDTSCLIPELKKENEMLKETLRIVVASSKLGKFEKEINDLKVITKYLQETVINQQREIGNLKKIISDHASICPNLCHNNKKDTEGEKYKDKCFELGELQSLPPFPLLK